MIPGSVICVVYFLSPFIPLSLPPAQSVSVHLFLHLLLCAHLCLCVLLPACTYSMHHSSVMLLQSIISLFLRANVNVYPGID